ncbi:Insulin-like growth factor binding protein, N-terminal [Pseudocohnilembus persalinus]|uniref:Insulin-like growth factor binding protein, N-terminal n=1 Tax=Pseudocohnilembus persalinus TaxID=266149 RepID=A0A0V0QP96_PSEPJ|nr:Insulin-like growth factor binding protein, N-terminal [Pseudocohnilembus persalinus]|eukprot:KRX04211.1 Insulin-like growth factor binding protein, N-terminal [Pseudocohnilembus persalinus]
MKVYLIQTILLSLLLTSTFQANSYSVTLTAPGELTAVASVTTDLLDDNYDTMIAVGYAVDSYLILNKPFKAQKTKVFFSDINEEVRQIVNIPSSQFAVIFFETQFVIINVEQAFNGGTYSSPYDISGDYQIQKYVSLKPKTIPTIAKEYKNDQEWKYALAYISDSNQLYVGVFTIFNGKIKNYTTQTIAGATSVTQSAAFLYYDYGIMIVYSNPSTIYFYSLVSMDIVASDQSNPNFTNQLSALSAPEGTYAVVASDVAGSVKAIGLPKKVSGYDGIFQNSVELRETLFDSEKLGTNSVSKITPVTYTQYILISGSSNYLLMTEIFDSNKNDIIDDQNSVIYVGQKVDYLSGTGLIVMQNFDNTDSTNNFNKQVILYKICGEGQALSLSNNGCQKYDSDDDYDDVTGVLKECGYTTYYDNGKCVPCPSDCNTCSTYTYYDYSTDSKEDCKTCDDNGECICRQDVKCESGLFFDFDQCKCISCSSNQEDSISCLNGMVFSYETCSCVTETCSDNENCAKCDQNDSECLECTNEAMSTPECVCYKGYYFNYDENSCKPCKDPDCVQCSGENGEVCMSYSQSSEQQSKSDNIAYPFFIVAGVAGSYLIVFIGAKIMKKWARRKNVSKPEQIPSKSVYPEYSKQHLTNKPENFQSLSILNIQQRQQSHAGVEISTNDNISNPASDLKQDNRAIRKNRKLAPMNQKKQVKFNSSDQS